MLRMMMIARAGAQWRLSSFSKQAQGRLTTSYNAEARLIPSKSPKVSIRYQLMDRWVIGLVGLSTVVLQATAFLAPPSPLIVAKRRCWTAVELNAQKKGFGRDRRSEERDRKRKVQRPPSPLMPSEPAKEEADAPAMTEATVAQVDEVLQPTPEPTEQNQPGQISDSLRQKLEAFEQAVNAWGEAREDEEEGPVDYDPEFVAEQKRLRDELDFNRPYRRDRPRSWDFITGLPVPRLIRLTRMMPMANAETRAIYRQSRPNDPEYMAHRIKEVFTQDADKEVLRNWYIANRDWLGQHIKLVICAHALRNVWLKNMEEAQAWHNAMLVYGVVDQAVTAPIQQAMREAEGRLSQNLGNLDMVTVAGQSRGDKAAMWITLKSVLAKWETRRQQYLKKPERTIVEERALSGTRKVVALFQKMNVAFSECEQVMQALPVEIRFLDYALAVESGTELRRYAIKAFCPANAITLEELRERIRMLYHLIEIFPAEEHFEIHDKLVDVYKALALGSAEVFTEDPLAVVARLLPPETMDPKAPFAFRMDPRLDAAGFLNRTIAQNFVDKLDVYIKKTGIPFPESPKVDLEARQTTEDLWFDRWAVLFGQKPEDWYPIKKLTMGDELRLQGFGQDYIDRMQREITRRRMGKKDGEEDPITKWQYDFMAKSPEEQEAFELELEKKRESTALDIKYLDEDGKIVSLEEVQERYRQNPEYKPSIPAPKVWLRMLKERNEPWRRKQKELNDARAVEAARVKAEQEEPELAGVA